MNNIGYFILGVITGVFNGFLLCDSAHKIIEILALRKDNKSEFENLIEENEKRMRERNKENAK